MHVPGTWFFIGVLSALYIIMMLGRYDLGFIFIRSCKFNIEVAVLQWQGAYGRKVRYNPVI